MQEFVMEEALGDNSVMCESAGEYTLPDYMPEVRRVLRVSADAAVTGQYERGDRTEVGGDTHYTVLYTDPEGHLAAAEEEGTFEGVVALPQGTPSLIWPQTENVSCRLAGPRKLSLRAGVRLHPHAHRCATVTPPAVEEGAGIVETLCRPMRVSTTKYMHADDIFLTDSMTCEEGTQPLVTDACALIREVKCEDGIMRVRGEVWVTVLCNTPQGTPVTHSCKIPFEEMLTCDGVMPDFVGVARSSCRRVSCQASEDAKALLVDIGIVLDGMAVKNEMAEVVTDLFATQYDMVPVTEAVTGRWYPVLQMANFTVDGAVPRESLGVGEEPLQPISTHATVASAGCTSEGSTVTVEGSMRVTCVLACDVTDGSYRCESFDIPYRVRISCSECIPGDTRLSAEVTCIACRARADGTRLGVDAELGVLLLGTQSETREIIRAAEPNPDSPVAHPDDEIIAAYLSDGDTLWSIAKRYHVPLADIVRANSLPEEIMDNPDFAQEMDGLSRLMLL